MYPPKVTKAFCCNSGRYPGIRDTWTSSFRPYMFIFAIGFKDASITNGQIVKDWRGERCIIHSECQQPTALDCLLHLFRVHIIYSERFFAYYCGNATCVRSNSVCGGFCWMCESTAASHLAPAWDLLPALAQSLRYNESRFYTSFRKRVNRIQSDLRKITREVVCNGYRTHDDWMTSHPLFTNERHLHEVIWHRNYFDRLNPKYQNEYCRPQKARNKSWIVQGDCPDTIFALQNML
jgi:hypothetical protein